MWRLQMVGIRKSLLLLGLCPLLGVFNISFSLAKQDSSAHSKTTLETGRTTYNSSCAGCHGLDGSGTDKAVNISTNSKVRHLSDTQLAGIISNGVPGTGMPAFHNLSKRQTRAVVGYLRSLQGNTEVRALPGNAIRGKEIFFGKANAQVATRSPGKAVSLDPICLATEQAPHQGNS